MVKREFFETFSFFRDVGDFQFVIAASWSGLIFSIQKYWWISM